MNKASNPHAFTRNLDGAQFHLRRAGDLAQHLGRVAEAVALAPKHLVEQVFHLHGGPARWIRPSRHAQRVAVRPEGHKTHAQHQQTEDHQTLALHFAQQQDERLFGGFGTEAPAQAALQQERAAWAMGRLCEQGVISEYHLARFEGGDAHRRAYAALPLAERLDLLPLDEALRAACLEAIAAAVTGADRGG